MDESPKIKKTSMQYMMRLLLLSLSLLFISTVNAAAQGPVAQGFSAHDMQGAEISLEDFRGKVVVLNFWSTRCAICHSEIPSLNKMVSTFKGKDVVFLGITVENPSKVAPYLKQTPFDFSIVPNGFGVLLKYAEKDADGVISMPYPSFFVIDPEGRIALKTAGAGKAGQMSGAISRLLSSK